MRNRLHLAVLTLSLLLLSLVSPLALADETVEIVFFFSPTCESCHIVREQVMPPFLEKYGDRLIVTYVDVSAAEGLAQLETIEAHLGKANNPLPVLVIGDTIIASEDVFEVEDQLAAFLSERLPEHQDTAVPPTAAPTVAQASTSTTAPASHALKPIHVAYIAKDGCESCARALVVLETLQKEVPSITITEFNHVRDGDLVEAMGKYLGLPTDRRMIAPSIYIGKRALIDSEINSSAVRALLAEYAETGAPAFWEDLDVTLGQQSILARFRTMGPLAVVMAALIDGINPCAFATIILFVSYLAISRRKRADLLMIGLAFTAGVFITYLLVGLGAMSLLKLANTMRILGLALYSLMAISCFVLAGLSVRDYLMARQGRLHDMKLNLPEPLRERIKVRIRAGRRASAGVAFVTGLIVSVLELACTGQVYLPTISFVAGIPEMRASATAYLVLYNVVFVIPLLVVLWLAAYGVSAKRFQAWFVQNAAKTKLIMAVLFVLLGFLLLSQVITL